MADPEVVAALLNLAHDGFVLVSRDVIERTTVDDLDAVLSLLRLDLDCQRVETVRALRDFAAEAQRLLDERPDWGR